MGKFNLLDFIRSMKKARHKQVIGSLFALDAKTNELCACALGEGVLNSNVIDEEKLRKEIKANHVRKVKVIYDPITGKKESREVLIPNYGTQSELSKAGTFLNQFDGSFRVQVVHGNDRLQKSVADIAAEMYSRYAELINYGQS